jgi:hypothetical protein
VKRPGARPAGKRPREEELAKLRALWRVNRNRRDIFGLPLWWSPDGQQAQQLAKVRDWKNKKNISGKDVIEILEIAGTLTKHPAYQAAQDALVLHRLHRGGVKRALLKLHDRHVEPPEIIATYTVDIYMKERGYPFRRAVEHVVAEFSVPGTSFDSAVDKVRKAYGKLKKGGELNRDKYHAERMEYFAQLQNPQKLAVSK